MTVKQVFCIFLQVVGMLTFVAAGVAGTLIYIGAQKKQLETITLEKPVRLAPESEPELKELTPVSFSKPSNAEKVADVKRKAKSRPAKNPLQKPVTYSTPKKVAPVAKVEKKVPAATKPVAPTKAQIRKMAVSSAKPLHYGPSPETKAQVQSILQFRATDNNVPFEVQRARPSLKISGAGMSDLERQARANVEKEKIDAGLKAFWTTGEMQKK